MIATKANADYMRKRGYSADSIAALERAVPAPKRSFESDLDTAKAACEAHHQAQFLELLA